MPLLAKKNVVIITNIGKTSRRDCLCGIFRFTRENMRWHLRLVQSDESQTSRASSEIKLDEIDGVITTESTQYDIQNMLARADMPIVAIGSRPTSRLSKSARIALVKIDDGEIGRFGAERLCSYGRFAACAFVKPSQSTCWANLRAEHFKAEFNRLSNRCPYFEHCGEDRLSGWLNALPKPAAVMAANDTLAFSVLETAATEQIAVPQSLAVIGVDNDALLCDMAKVPLSSILPDHEDVGFKAAAELQAMLNGRQSYSPRTILCKGHRFVERESSRPLVPAAHIIREALSFMHKNATSGITPAVVATHLGVSRRLLDLRFHEFSGRTVAETIQDFKIKKVRKLLTETKLPIKKITEDCGFPNETYPKELFKRRFGITMRAWRNANGTA